MLPRQRGTSSLFGQETPQAAPKQAKAKTSTGGDAMHDANGKLDVSWLD
jgi:hypothetical protein